MTRILVLLMLITLVTGCASAIEGQPNAEGAIDPSDYYGFELSPEEQQVLLLNQAVRQIDPCGLLDRAAIEAKGRIDDFGPNDSVADCSVRYVPPGRTSDHRVWATVELDTPVLLGPQAGEVHGVPIYESSSSTGGSDYCYRYVPLEIELPDVDSGNADVTVTPPTAYALVDVFGAEGPPCEAAAEIAGMVVAAMQAGPPQRDADTPVPLGALDPCAVLGHLPAGYDATSVRFAESPFKCNIEFEGDRRLAVTLQLQPDLLLDDSHIEQWSGGEFVIADVSGCFAQYRTGTHVEFDGDGNVAEVLFQTFTCDTVEELADGIIAAYGA